jgi:cytochrome P450
VSNVDSVESAGGRLGAVLAAPRAGVIALGRTGPWLAASHASARRVLTDPACFDFPSDVSRSGDLSGSTGDTRSGHSIYVPLTPDQVSAGIAMLAREWDDALAEHDRTAPGTPYDAMVLLRRPVARSTTAAVLRTQDETLRKRVADEVLAWIDALGPVISARRPPRRWSRTRRAEVVAREALEGTLATVPALDGTPAEAATMLAAGIQVPIAAGSWLLAWLADHPSGSVDPTAAVWETIRLTPPTWITARITTTDVEVGGTTIPAGAVVMVSPLQLGRLPHLVPGDPGSLSSFQPERWGDGGQRPGAWLPFGAGPHACPGRTLGLAQLTHLAQWAVGRELTLSERATVDQSRGIFPAPCRFSVAPRGEGPP